MEALIPLAIGMIGGLWVWVISIANKLDRIEGKLDEANDAK